MLYSCYRKGLVISIVVLFVGAGIVSGVVGNIELTADHGKIIAHRGTIYIRPDGSIDPPTANLYTDDNITYYFTGNINDEIVVERGNITIDGNGYMLQGSGSGTGIRTPFDPLGVVHNLTIINTTIEDYGVGIRLITSSHNNVSNNIITINGLSVQIDASSDYNIVHDNEISGAISVDHSSYNEVYRNTINLGMTGIALYYSSNNMVYNNNIINPISGISLHTSVDNKVHHNMITYCSEGIRIEASSNNTFSSNNITTNSRGIWMHESSNNTFYHNDFNNPDNVYIIAPNYANVWDYGYPYGGNWWQDYTGDDFDGDGIGDTAYVIDGDNSDQYPLMYRWTDYVVHNLDTQLGYDGIQSAHDAPETGAGDTIFVDTGTYYEHLDIDTHAIALVGEDKYDTIIDGSNTGTVVFIRNENNITLSGFTIQHSGTEHYDEDSGISQWSGADGNLSNNIITNNYYGIILDFGDDTTVYENIVTDNKYGLFLNHADHNNLIRNIIDSNTYGISLDESRGTSLSGNLVANHSRGIYFDHSGHCEMRNNTMANNSYNFGIRGYSLVNYLNDIDTSNTVDSRPMYYWVEEHDQVVPPDAGYVGLINCSNITVENLTIRNNRRGILVAMTSDSVIRNNTLVDNQDHGISLWRLLRSEYYTSDNNEVYNNTVTNNGGNGIDLYGGYDNLIYRNNITDNGGTGVSLSLAYTGGFNTVFANTIDSNNRGVLISYGSDNFIFGNNITNNAEGIYVSLTSGNHVYHNNFIYNTDQVITDDSGTLWDDGYPSGGNYWVDYFGYDDFSGPDQTIPGGDGFGDTPYIIDGNNQDNYPWMLPLYGVSTNYSLNLHRFPMYLAEEPYDQMCGAAVGQMFLDFLNWNRSIHPDGPPPVYNQGWIYDNFTSFDVPQEYLDAGLNWYEDPNYIDAWEMWLGLAWGAYQHGYHFWTHVNESEEQILKIICVMIDYPIPVPEGYPPHCPAAVPAYGDYSNWMVIRGMFCDKKPWLSPAFPDFTIFGFWMNDPMIDGIGEDTYKTVDELLMTYYYPLELPGDPYEDGKFTVVVEPPENFDISQLDTIQLDIGQPPGGFSQQDTRLVNRLQRRGMMKAPELELLVDNVLFSTAFDALSEIALIDENLGAILADIKLVTTVFVRNLVGGSNYYLVVFSSQESTLVVRLNAHTGTLLEYSISHDQSVQEYLAELGMNDTSRCGSGRYTGGSPFYPTIT